MKIENIHFVVKNMDFTVTNDRALWYSIFDRHLQQHTVLKS